MNETIVPKDRVVINPVGTETLCQTWQFSEAVRVGDQVWVSGQLGIGPDGEPAPTIEEQSRLAFQNLSHVLEEAGGVLADVVDLTSFHVTMEDLPIFATVKSEFFPKDFPAWTVIGVSELALPRFLIEIKAIAIIGSGLEHPEGDSCKS